MAGTTHLKRQKELDKRERKQEKEERRRQRSVDKAEQPDRGPGFDPDIDGIVPGPQPVRDEFEED